MFKDFLRQARWIIAVFVLAGLLLAVGAHEVAPQSAIVANLLEHLGSALVITGLVGLFLELTEIKSFFEQRLLSLLSKDEFVRLIDEERLVEIVISAIRGIGTKRASNEEYESYNFALTLGYNVIEPYVGRPYRRDLFETIDYAILRDSEVRELGLDPEKLSEKVVRIKSHTQYQVVPPNEHDDYQYEVSFFETTYSVPGLDAKKHFELEITVDDKKVEADFSSAIRTDDNLTVMEVEKKIPTRGNISVELDVTQYEYGTSGSLVNYAVQVTHNTSVHFSSREPLDLQADVFGVAGNFNAPSITGNSVSLQYSGWVLPGQGYYISWRPQRP